MKMRILTPTVLALTGLASTVIPLSLAHAQTAPAQSAVGYGKIPTSTQFAVSYKGSLFVLPIGELTVRGTVNARGYSMRTDMKTSGFGKISKEGGLWSTSIGFYDDTRMQPSMHIIQKLNKKGRRIDMRYDADGNPKASIVPTFGSMGMPPATTQERQHTVDAMSGILQMMLTGHQFGDKPCTGFIPVFDGKARYNLRLEHAGEKKIRQSSYSGMTTRCNVYLETVSGYDTEDLLTEEEASAPLQVYLVNFEDAGLYVPVRFDYRISGIKVNIKATNIQVKNG